MTIQNIDIKFANTKDPNIKGVCSSRVIFPTSFSEVRLFALLMHHFGPPNGFMFFVNGPSGDPDGPFKWDYVFNLPDFGTIEILRTWNSLEARCRGVKIKKAELLEFLSNNIARYNDDINNVTDSLENYSLMINPYARHKSMASMARSELKKIVIRKPFYPSDIICKKSEITRHKKTYSNYLIDTEKETFYSII
ncbi:MAG: hypothetical protein GY870_04865 [archaeon]|nr:hypothetical protein [archaeon]